LSHERDYIEEYKILYLDLFCLNCDDNKNNYVILKDNTIVCVLNIAKSQDNNLYIIGKNWYLIEICFLYRANHDI